jgi:hypothetical protein
VWLSGVSHPGFTITFHFNVLARSENWKERQHTFKIFDPENTVQDLWSLAQTSRQMS